MDREFSFGEIVKEHRQAIDLTQAELARRVACATITIRKIESDALRPSIQIAERLATSLKIPLEERAAFVRLARASTLKTPTPQSLPTPPPAPEEIGLEDLSGRAIRGYELGDRMGEGGFGVVYRAIQPLVEREVAVKIILPRYADHPEFIRRFEAEAQLVARLEHPYIVPLYDYWREPGAAFLVMRLMRGGSLHSRLKEGPLSLDFILRLLNQVGSALFSAHRMGVIHRDLKPANIMLDEDQNTYLADFGVAKNLGNPEQTSDTMLAGIIGSPAYVSPEQIRSESVRPQADIYALGVLLFELLTGRQPFPGPTPIDYAQQHLNQPTPPLLEFNPNLPPSLEPVLTRATAKSPDDRYPDIPGLVRDFQSAVTSAGVEVPASITLDWLPAEQVDIESLENPYKGLRAFQEADAEDFFGRETLVQDLLGRMAEENDLSRFLAVVGPSGSGKSSAVKASLIPSLRRGGLPGSEHWFIVEFTPGAHPFEELETALLRVAVNPPESLLGQLRQDERGLLRAVNRILPPDKNVELVLVIDQFEELFTLLEDETIRAVFLESLLTALLDPRTRLRVVITLRADFTDRPLEYVDFGDLLRQRTEFVLPLTSDELELAIIQPARGAGLAFEAGLCERIIRALGDQPGTLPLLQYTLTELFERRVGRRLTIQAYQDSGGVLGALGKRAEEIYTSLDRAGQATARQVFLRLVTLGEGVEDTRRRVLQSELDALTSRSKFGTSSIPFLNELPESRYIPDVSPGRRGGTEGVNQVLDSFGRARLLSFDRDPLTRGPTVEVAHEALLREWSRLRDWLAQSRADIRSQRVLGNAAAEWLQSDHDPSFLLRGSRLDQFAAWAESTDLTLTNIEQDYLEACLAERFARESAEAERLAHEAALERRSRNILRVLVGVFAIATVISLVLAWLAISAQNQTRAQQEIAQSEAEQRSTAEAVAFEQQAEALTQANARATAESRNILRQDEEYRAISAQTAVRALEEHKGPNPELAVLVALELLERYPYTPQAERALNQAVLENPTRMIPRIGAESLVTTDIYWSPTGETFVTPLMDNEILIQDINTGEEVRRIPTEDECNQVQAWSPSGDRLPAFGNDCPPVIYSTQTGEQIAVLDSAPGVTFTSASWSPDGTALVTGNQDNTAQIWDAVSGHLLSELIGHGHYVSEVAWSPDGEKIATASRDTDARVWDAASGDLLYIFPNHIAMLNGVSWAPDSQKIASAGADNVAYVWDPSSGRILLRLSGHKDGVSDVAWSPDGKLIATLSYDQTVRVWDSDTGLQLFQFNTNSFLENDSISWSPTGQQLLIAGMHYHRIWDISQLTPVLNGHTDLILDAQFSPDGLLVATSSRDNTLRIWQTENGTLLKLYNLEDQPLSIAWSPDGEYLASSSQDGMVIVWGIDSGSKSEMDNPSKIPIESLTWSPDRSFLTGFAQPAGIITAWSADTGERIQLLGRDQGCPPQLLSWAPENDYLLLGCAGESRVVIWDLTRGELQYEPEISRGKITTAAWSPDGNFIAIGHSDGTIDVSQVFDLPNETFSLPSQGYEIMDLSWAPNSQRIASAESGGAVRIWDLPSQGEVSFFQVPGSAETVDWSADGDQIIITASVGTSPFIRRVWPSREAQIRSAYQCCAKRELTQEERVKFELTLE